MGGKPRPKKKLLSTQLRHVIADCIEHAWITAEALMPDDEERFSLRLEVFNIVQHSVRDTDSNEGFITEVLEALVAEYAPMSPAEKAACRRRIRHMRKLLDTYEKDYLGDEMWF